MYLEADRIAVIVHDFPSANDDKRRLAMDKFKQHQWSTFRTAGLVMICGELHQKVDMAEKDWSRLVAFLNSAAEWMHQRYICSEIWPKIKKTTLMQNNVHVVNLQ